ncbi:MAG: glycerophosphoryl diester phosphodiesterase membrane domain-containing protein [Bifidobacteriaceae bacterium]|nr:glycerophosphoryl diester phosphodiesterase membrane domain-containing protein [Bifidobacteriaceae bacterium]
MRPGTIPLRPLGLGDIFDGAVRSIRFAPSVMFGLTALVMVVAGLAQSFPLFMPQASIEDFLYADEVNSMLANGAGQIVAFLASAILTGMLTYTVAQGAIGKKVTIGSSWNAIGRRIPPLIGQVFLVALMLAAAILVPLVPLVIGLAIGQDELGSNVGMAIVLGLAGLFAAAAAACWVTVRTVFAPAALVLEGQGVIQSIKRSWQLTQGRFWRTLGIYLLVSMIAGMIAGVVSVPVSLVALFATEASTIGLAVSTVVATVLSGMLSTPFVAATVALLYLDARIRSEGLDLALMRAAQE